MIKKKFHNNMNIAEKRLEKIGGKLILGNDRGKIRLSLNADIATLSRLEKNSRGMKKMQIKRIHKMFKKAKRRIG